MVRGGLVSVSVLFVVEAFLSPPLLRYGVAAGAPDIVVANPDRRRLGIAAETNDRCIRVFVIGSPPSPCFARDSRALSRIWGHSNSGMSNWYEYRRAAEPSRVGGQGVESTDGDTPDRKQMAMAGGASGDSLSSGRRR